MALAFDSSTPAPVSNTSGSTITSQTTAAFTPPLGALLVVTAQQGNTAQSMTQPSNTGGAVTWDAAAKVELKSPNASAIWFGKVTTSASMTVTINLAVASNYWGGCVAVVTGQAASQSGAATGTNGNAAQTPTVTTSNLVGTNSFVIASIADGSDMATPTIPAGQSDVFGGRTLAWTGGAGTDSGWVQYLTSPIAPGNPATLNDTAPTGIRHTTVAAEILADSTAALYDVLSDSSDTTYATGTLV